MRVGKALCGGALLLAGASVGCGEADYVGPPPSRSPIASPDPAHAPKEVHVAGCRSRQDVRATPGMRHAKSSVIIRMTDRPRRARRYAAKPWLTPLTLRVKTGNEPVELAIDDVSGGASVGLAVGDRSAQRSSSAAYRRIRFLPCKGDPSGSTWHVWKSALVADQKAICAHLVVRDSNRRNPGQTFNF